MDKFYTDEKNVQILIALLKAHGIRQAILSPGSANSPLVASLQYDKYFKTFSCVDERSAAYMACGLAEESGEPVVLSCTGATASRNYLPGITEAYYRRLPILAVTSTQPIHRVGHHIAQVVDRSVQPNDTYTYSTTLPIVKDEQDRIETEVKINEAILQLKRSSGGTVHINLQTSSLRTYTTKELPVVRKINRFTYGDQLPELPEGKIAVFVGSHRRWTKEEVHALDTFCAANNAVIFCDHTSNYHGKYRILSSLIGGQQLMDISLIKPELSIHIGEITGDYYSIKLVGKEVWRVNPDGQLRDTFGRLSNIFELDECTFFQKYSTGTTPEESYFQICFAALNGISEQIPSLPFSNIWAASQLAPNLPLNSTLHFGILNSLRSWNFFEVDPSVRTSCNVGGFGIDGILSTVLGASLADPQRITFCVIGDLAFFYDLNALGNRHLQKNLRILLVNNGKGTEFQTYKHHTSHFGKQADEFISAAGHFGQQSPTLVMNFAKDLGFDYLSSSCKEGFKEIFSLFTSPSLSEKPILLELFIKSEDESKALELILNIEQDFKSLTSNKLKNFARTLIGQKGIDLLKKGLK
jgi:2-succinyl-5-enolpyruvyl-6-hydroxy-3-cyclohexene-1-carboxylate synthase